MLEKSRLIGEREKELKKIKSKKKKEEKKTNCWKKISDFGQNQMAALLLVLPSKDIMDVAIKKEKRIKENKTQIKKKLNIKNIFICSD